MTATDTNVTTQVFRVWIKATPEAIWDAITKPEWTDRYGYGGFAEYGDLQPGTPYVVNAGTGMQAAGIPAGPIIEGEVVEADPPRRFVQTWRMLMDPGLAVEPYTRVTYDLIPESDGVTRLTVTHEVDDAPKTAQMIRGAGEGHLDEGGGGWAWILSDLKSLLETGSGLGG